MQKLLEHFHQDHMSMQRMVRRFNFEADLLRDCSSDPDYFLLLTMTQSFVDEHEKSHYDAEKKLHDCLRYAMPEVTPLVQRLEEHHQEQCALGQELIQLLKAACSGHLVPRERITELVEAFLDHLCVHIAEEESLIIANAEQWMSKSEWRLLEGEAKEWLLESRH